jgi:replication factor C subunit 2/4
MQWVEKYRPNNLEGIKAQNNVIQSLQNAIYTKNIPHLVFYGSSGCGKTSTILALAKDLFGREFWNNRVIELNASDERGINVVREKIKMYAKQSVKLNDNIPPWKIIILDEADTMTPDSQFALRRIMEQYSKVTRFCIICNYHNKIIDPILSRCSLFCFKPINPTAIYEKLIEITKLENFNISDNIIHKIINISRGDLRKAINLLQKCYNINNSNNMLEQVSGILPDHLFNSLIDSIFNKNINQATEIVNTINLQGYSLVNQILLIHDYIINNTNLNTQQKSNIILKISDIDQNLIKGCDEYIQFIRLIYYIISII